ncbi:hypothetical protein [Streptomyces qinglanensis]|uniref:hypothetical protein n=1 Tax=Streptomyces qinglanensis TaxID=943816 RepID=UPI003D70DE6B
MDAGNRVRLEVARSKAARVVPALGWTTGMVRAVQTAAAGRLTHHDGACWHGRRRVARHRVQMLTNGGFLTTAAVEDSRLAVTPAGELALYLARLAPEHVHPDDASAYAARLRAVSRRAA